MRINRRPAVVVALIAAAGLSQAAAPAAIAADYPVVVNFPTASVTVEYGQGWSIPVYTDFLFYDKIALTGSAVVSSTSTPSGFVPSYYFAPSYGEASSSIYTPYDFAPLPVGSYTFSVNGTYEQFGDTYTGQTPSPATLKIEKAKLGVELRVLADGSNGDDAIVTAKFTGRFVDEYSPSYFESSAISPAGTWQIVIKDKDGEVAVENTVERAAGDDVLATSFYWTDAEPGVQYTVTAEFTPSGTSGNNFTITPAQAFSYTAPDAQRPQLSSTATAKPDTSLPEATGFGLPLWLLIVVIVLIVGLGTLVTILSVRLTRRPSTSTGEVSS